MDIRINLFFSKLVEVSTKILPFLKENWEFMDFLQKIPLYVRQTERDGTMTCRIIQI